jgi:Uma2 family endonuclease
LTQASDWTWLQQAIDAPVITLEVYLGIPEDLSKRVEVVDGRLIRCESPGPSHQTIQHNLIDVLRGPVKDLDARDQTCHKVNGDLDMLITEVPRFHYRRPDVLVYRCIETDRGKWRRKPYSSDCLLVVEIVSPDSVTTDTRDKLSEYADAGIPHYWIVKMAGNDGPAVSVERFRLNVAKEYVSEGLAIRGKSVFAVDAIDPFETRISWEQLDEGI